MKKQNIISTIIVTSVMLIVSIVSMSYLPDEIAVPWNENGVSNTASKLIILIFPALNIIFLALHSQNSRENRERFDFIILLVSLMLFATQAIIILNALEYINMLSLNYRLMQTIALLVIGLIICGYGNKIPKFAMNYYCGVKSDFAFNNNDLWTKTQRFSVKIWFVSGLVIILLSFIQWKGITLFTLVIILFIIIIPRIYSKSQYKTENSAKSLDKN